MITASEIHPSAGIKPGQLAHPALPGVPLTLKPIRYVDANAAGAADQPNSGFDPDKGCFATMVYACQNVPANTVVIVRAGHTESIEAATTLFGNAGVYVIGEGRGEQRPTISFATSTAAKLSISKASCVLQNLLFKNTIDDLVNAFSLSAAADECKLLDIEYRDDSADETIDCIKLTSGAEHVVIDGLRYIGNVGGNSCKSAIVTQNNVGLLIRNFFLFGDFSEGAIVNDIDCTTAPGIMIDGGRGSTIWISGGTDNIAISVQDPTVGYISGPLKIRIPTDGATIDEVISGETPGTSFSGAMHMYNTAGHIIGVVNKNGESEMQWPGVPSDDTP